MKEVDRVRLLSLAGFAILIVLCGSAIAVSFAPSDLDQVTGAETFGPGIGVQAGTTADPSPSSFELKSAAAASPSPLLSTTTQTPLVTARYRTIALLGLGGFDTEVTVASPSGPVASWTVILVMPANKQVENRSPNLVTMKQEGTKITITPTAKAQLPLMFSIRFPAVLALGGRVSSCTIDGRPCKAE